MMKKLIQGYLVLYVGIEGLSLLLSGFFTIQVPLTVLSIGVYGPTQIINGRDEACCSSNVGLGFGSGFIGFRIEGLGV